MDKNKRDMEKCYIHKGFENGNVTVKMSTNVVYRAPLSQWSKGRFAVITGAFVFVQHDVIENLEITALLPDDSEEADILAIMERQLARVRGNIEAEYGTAIAKAG